MTTLAFKNSSGDSVAVRGRATGEMYTVDKTGANGVLNVTGTGAQTGTWAVLVCITDTVFNVLTETGATGSLTGISVPAGTALFGQFTAFTLTSGVVRAYVA